MPDQTEPRAKSAGLMVAALAFLIFGMPALYVLSVGPVAWLLEHDLVDGDLVRVFYRPLFRAAESLQPLASFLAWYITAWGGVV